MPDGGVTETALIVGTVVSVASAAAGSIISYQAQQTQSENTTRIAAYNAAVQQQQSNLSSRMAVRQAQINAQFIQTQQNQTVGIDNEAKAIQAQAQEDINRNQERQRRMMATQRANYASAGVLVDGGSPVAVLADTASIFELQNQDTQYAADTKAAALRRQAELARYGLAADASVQALNEQAGYAAGRIGSSQAELTRLEGASAAQGYRTASYGSLLSGVGAVGSGVSSYFSGYAARHPQISSVA